MKIDVASKYSTNRFYSNVFGSKTLKKPKKDKPIKYENKGQYIDIKI